MNTTNETRNILVAIMVLVFVAGAYYVGTTSKDIEQKSTFSTPEKITVSKLAAQDVQNNTQPAKNNLVQDSANGLKCKNIANAAAQNSQRTNTLVYVTKSNFSKTYKNCYYELQFTYTKGDYSTELHVAPNDDWVAQCTSGIYPSQLFCTPHNTFYPEWQGRMTEAQYQQIRARYLTN